MDYNDDIYTTFRKLRRALNESGDSDMADGVPYTMEDELMRSITQTCKQQFGADFSQSKTPMIYYPPESEDGENVILSGVIGTMNNTKFQFKYRDTNGGCYIWTNPVMLNERTLPILNVIYGVYRNWQKEISESEDFKPMSLKNDEGEDDYIPSIPNGNV